MGTLEEREVFKTAIYLPDFAWGSVRVLGRGRMPREGRKCKRGALFGK